MIQRVLLALLALAAFALTSALLGRVTPLEPFYPTRQLERIQQPGAGFDVLFLGSSHVHSGIDPSAFDRRMNEYGCPTHSYNFGIPGMNPPQMSVLVDRLLEERPAELETVFVEIYWNLWRRELGDSAEFVYWHDAAGTLTALAAELLTWDDPVYRLRLARLHLRAFALRASHARLGYQSLHRRLVEEPATARELMLAPIAATNGFRRRTEHLPDVEQYAGDATPLRGRKARGKGAGAAPSGRSPARLEPPARGGEAAEAGSRGDPLCVSQRRRAASLGLARVAQRLGDPAPQRPGPPSSSLRARAPPLPRLPERPRCGAAGGDARGRPREAMGLRQGEPRCSSLSFAT